MKCQYCDGTGEHINDANRMTTCEFCGGTGEVELTQEEWLCSLPTAKKALVIAELSSYGGNVYALEKWLKEKHHDSVQG